MSYEAGEAFLLRAHTWDPESCKGDDASDPCPLQQPVTIALPHSCQEWEIGGVKEAAQLIADLKALILRLRPPGDAA